MYTQPFQPSRFQLNHASAKNSGEAYSEREYSIWVADLPSDISEDEFRKTFATRYESIKTTKGKIFFVDVSFVVPSAAFLNLAEPLVGVINIWRHP